jgi:hypothetical protein
MYCWNVSNVRFCNNGIVLILYYCHKNSPAQSSKLCVSSCRVIPAHLCYPNPHFRQYLIPTPLSATQQHIRPFTLLLSPHEHLEYQLQDKKKHTQLINHLNWSVSVNRPWLFMYWQNILFYRHKVIHITYFNRILFQRVIDFQIWFTIKILKNLNIVSFNSFIHYDAWRKYTIIYSILSWS